MRLPSASASTRNRDAKERGTVWGISVGHTAFGHTGETVLREILCGEAEDLRLPGAVVAEAGGGPENVIRLTIYVVDRREYLSEAIGVGRPDFAEPGRATVPGST